MKTADFGSKLPNEIRYFFPQLSIKFWKVKKYLLSLGILKHLTFSMIFQKHISPYTFWESNPNFPTWHQILAPIRMLETIFFYYMYKYIYIPYLYTHKVKRKLKDISILRPIHPIKIALRARPVNPALDSGGSGTELVGKGSGTARARLATVRF